MAACGLFDDIIFQCKDGSDTHTYLIQLKHKSKPIQIASLVSTRGKFSLFEYLNSYRTIRNDHPNKSELKSLGSFDSFRFVIYTNADIFEQDNYKLNENSMLNSGGVILSFQNKNDDEVYNTFKDHKLFSDFLDDVGSLNLPTSTKHQEIQKRLDNLKTKVKSKVMNMKLNESINFTDKSTLVKLKQTMEDTSFFEEFLNNLRVYSNQVEIDSNIKHEIKKAYNTSEAITDRMFDELEKNITLWWKRTGNMLFLTETITFWQDIVNKIIHEIQLLSKPMTDKLTELQINFQDSEVNRLKDQIANAQALHITTQTSETVLTKLKVFQALQDECYIFINLNALIQGEINFLSHWKTTWCKYLIIEDTETSADLQNLSKKTAEILKNDDTKKFILISSRHSILTTHFNDILCNFTDHYNLTSFISHSQKLLLNKFINFQGYEMPLYSLVDEDENLARIISNEFLCKLVISEEDLMRVGCDIKKGIDYYIDRTLNRHIRINMTEIEKMSDSNVNIAISGRMRKGTQNNYIVFNGTQEEYEEISKNYDNFHWFHAEPPDQFIWKEPLGESSNRVVWKKSKGSIENIYKYLHTDWRKYTPKSLHDIEDQVVLIVGQPGIGKSTLVTHLAIETKNREFHDPSLYKCTWIVRVNLNDHTKVLEKISRSELTTDFVIHFLEEVLILSSDIERKLFEYSLKNRGNVVIIFDAYDEISPDYAEKVSIAMKELQKINKGKLYVTTRCRNRKMLEKELSTLSFILEVFPLCDQRMFLYEMWKSKFPIIDTCKLKEFIENLLELTEKSLSDKERKFTGVPLQTMMLAQVFEDNAREYCETQKQTLPPLIDLLDLYDKFVEKKLYIFWTEKNKFDLSLPAVQLVCETFRDNFMEDHKVCALMSLLPAVDLSTLKGFKDPTKFLSSIGNGKEKTGIIEGIIDGKPQFIHQTFSEYFAAIWFSENFKCNESFLTEHIFKSRYDVLKNVFDRVLAKDKELHKAILNNDKNTVQQLLEASNNVIELDKGGRTPLHLAVSLRKCSQTVEDSFNYSTFIYTYPDHMTDEDHIVKLLLKNKADINLKDEVLGWTPLQYADKYGSSFTILGLLLEYNANPKELKDTKEKIKNYGQAFIESTFMMAIENNFVSLVCYMIENGISVNLKLPRDSLRVTKECITIFHKSILSEKFDIACKLYEMGADTNITDSNGNTALHLASQNNKIECCQVSS
ncbi:hypothetical protein L9F63_021942 [Diploptera punctata]|uniref:NACHT domain-containing protein n=1 Tax=Diploptera punctata TaxID=6984 RepID=A0AAD8EBA4_DIPPU|nr:hypothetical protein L9F63_021942 [Diploptera punctata]